jgi:subtilisin family serine protease
LISIFVSLVAGAVQAGAFPAVPGELLVRFKADASQAAVESSNQAVGASVAMTFRGDPQLYLVRLPGGIDNDSGMQLYNNLGSVEHVEENLLYYPVLEPNDPRWLEQWGPWMVSAPAAWDLSIGSPTVVVANTDTGMDYNHPDLAGNIWVNTGEICNNGIDDDNNGYIDDCVGWNFFDDNNDPMDSNGHGSNTGGIIGAVGNNAIGVAGMMWSAQVMALKMGNGSFPTAAVIAAIDYAVNNGARVINASWGGGGESANMRAAIERASLAGVLFIAAAGNGGREITPASPFFPVSYALPNMIAVANTTSTDGLAASSNFGVDIVDLGAPGTGILSTYRNGGYARYTGTSQAAPHVTGTVGLIYSVNPSLTSDAVKALILSTVDPNPALQGRTITGGRLNAGAALLSTPPPVP